MEQCDHSEIVEDGFIYENGYLVECNQTCADCGKEWIWSYGSLEEK